MTTANIRALSPAGNVGGALEPVGRRAEHAGALVVGGGVVGYLFGRRHHPALWLGLAGALALAGAVAVTLWPFVLGAVVIVTAARAHSHGWPLSRYALTAGSWAGALALTIAGGAVAGAGGALGALAASWALWHCAIRPRAHSLSTRTAEHQSNPSAVNR